jgi:TRAP-type mannitol/chloroaromatic compound transport system substrate-binding protein
MGSHRGRRVPPARQRLTRPSRRRRFIVAAGGALLSAAGGLAAPGVLAQPKVQWRLSTAYPAAADILHGAAQRLARIVDETSAGRFRIQVFPGGQIVQPFECFDAAAHGTIQGFMAVSSYWAAREPALEWFQTIPFGMNPEGMAARFRQGDGLRLWEELYAAYGLVPRPSFSNAPQMGGWFRKRISTIGDFRGLRMRISGLGGHVIAKAGAASVVTPGAAIFASLERGVIDAAEWIGPHDDMKLGLHATARYYYYPGWHEPGTVQEFTFNKQAYDALPVDLRRILDHAVGAVHVTGLTDYRVKNALALERLRTEFRGKVEMLQFPGAVLRDLRKLATEVVREQSEKTPMARKVSASYARFQALVGPWDRVAEGAFHQLVAR